MKKVFNAIIRHPILIVIILILIAFVPQAIIREPDSSRRLIVTALGIDKIDNDYEVTALCFIPVSNNAFQENYKIISAKDTAFINALNKIGVYSGRITSLPHTSVVVVGQKVMEDNLTEVIDHLARTSNLGSNTVLVGTDDSAKKVIEIGNSLDSNSNLSLRSILAYNYQYIYGNQSNIESFYKGYFSPTKTSILGFIKLDDTDGISADEGQATSGSTGAGQGAEPESSAGQNQGASDDNGKNQQDSKSQKLLNDGSACVLVDGKLKLVLDGQMVEYYNWVVNQSNKSVLTIDDYSDENFKNANISFQVEQKPVVLKASYKNNVPQMNYVVNFILTLDEVNQQKYVKSNYLLSQQDFNQKMNNKIQNKVREDFSKLIDVLRESQVDIIDVYDTFTKYDQQKFENFIDSLDDPKDYLRYINYNIAVNVIIKA